LIIQAQYQIHVFDLNALVDFQVTWMETTSYCGICISSEYMHNRV
jgi:hypothetical protein